MEYANKKRRRCTERHGYADHKIKTALEKGRLNLSRHPLPGLAHKTLVLVLLPAKSLHDTHTTEDFLNDGHRGAV